MWGRGALDMKCQTVCNVLAFALIARSGIRPRGDLVLIAEADEEEGTTGVGLPFVVAQRPDLRTDYALNESSERLRAARRPAAAPVRRRREGHDARDASRRSGAPGTPRGRRRATTRSSSSRPRSSASPRTAPAGEPPPELLACSTSSCPAAAASTRASRARPSCTPSCPAMLGPLRGTTVSPTMVSASSALNVIPGRAELLLDCRVLPGTSPDKLLAELRACVGDLPVELELVVRARGRHALARRHAARGDAARLRRDDRPGRARAAHR